MAVTRDFLHKIWQSHKELGLEMASEGLEDKLHAVCMPCPFQSHIKAMLQLAKLLHHKGLHISFVNTEYNERRLLKSRRPNSLQGCPRFRFETIPDGLPPTDTDAAQDFAALLKATRENFLAPFCDLIAKLNHTSSSNIPPVTCIISDVFMPFTATAAEQLEIPVVLLVTTSACSFMAYKQFPAFIEKGLIPLKGESFLRNGYMDSVLDWIPGVKDIRLRDLPSFVKIKHVKDWTLENYRHVAETTSLASAIIFHTFDALEQEVLNAYTSMFPRLYTVGPLQLLLNQIQDDKLRSIGYNLWKEDTECLRWLDAKEPNSVVYVNFGSLVFMTEQQLIEIGMGLAKSNHPFLWIIRSDAIQGNSPVLPQEFLEETKDNGFITDWCPQEEVLKHPSTGCFVTHSGWNSTIESIYSGVPMLCWPRVADQPTNCKYTCNEWGIGMQIAADVNRDDVDRLVRDDGRRRGQENEEQSDAMEKISRRGHWSGWFIIYEFRQASGRIASIWGQRFIRRKRRLNVKEMVAAVGI